MGKVRMFHAASNRYQYDAAENFERLHRHEGWVLVDEEPEPAAVDDGTPVFSTENLPEGEWSEWRKKVTTMMVRIDGPFTVQTSEGPLRCADGWLAVDARGYPYPIATDDQEMLYEPFPPAEPAAESDLPPANPPVDDPPPADPPARRGARAK